MNLPLVTPELGDVLVDTDLILTSLSSFDSFKDGFEHLLRPADIFALFSLAEALILHERLISEWISEDDFKRSETIAMLVRAGGRVAQHGRVEGQARFQRSQRRLRLAFLDESYYRVKQKESGYHPRLRELVHEELQHDCSFKHPGYRRP